MYHQHRRLAFQLVGLAVAGWASANPLFVLKLYHIRGWITHNISHSLLGADSE